MVNNKKIKKLFMDLVMFTQVNRYKDDIQPLVDKAHTLIDEKCLWTTSDNNQYSTNCKNEFVFFEDGPEDNGFIFCPYCGCNITEHSDE